MSRFAPAGASMPAHLYMYAPLFVFAGKYVGPTYSVQNVFYEHTDCRAWKKVLNSINATTIDIYCI